MASHVIGSQLLMQWANSISSMAIVYSIIPFLFFWQMPNAVIWGIAVLIAPIVAECVKRASVVLGMEEWCARPIGARDCDTWNTNGPQGGAPGFPSGHTATTVAFWIGAFIIWPSASVAIVGFSATMTMIWARMQKRCHTLSQTIGGAMLGAGSYYIIFQLFKN